jgi:hypothetical protein
MEKNKLTLIVAGLTIIFFFVILVFFALSAPKDGKSNPISSFFFGSKSTEQLITGKTSTQNTTAGNSQSTTVNTQDKISISKSETQNNTQTQNSNNKTSASKNTSSNQNIQQTNQTNSQSVTRNSSTNNNQLSISPTQTPLVQSQQQAQLLTNFLSLFLNFQIPTNISTSTQLSSLIPTVAQSTLQKGNWKKTGVFILSNYSSGAQQIVKSKSPILKVMDPQAIGSLMQAVKDFKSVNPSGVVVFRIYDGSGRKYTLADSPASSALNYFSLVIQPALNSLGGNLQYFNFLETPNEFDSTPGLENPANAAWLSEFWSTLVDLNASKGVKTCVGSISVGNPGDIKGSMNAFLPALKKAKQSGGALCYHAYTLSYTTDVNQELNTSLRYRQIHDAITGLDGSLASLPIILSEAGVDQNGNQQTSGWLARGTQTQYLNWLRWFDSEISKDSYVLGATLFQIGDTSWSSFNLEPLAGYLRN